MSVKIEFKPNSEKSYRKMILESKNVGQVITKTDVLWQSFDVPKELAFNIVDTLINAFFYDKLSEYIQEHTGKTSSDLMEKIILQTTSFSNILREKMFMLVTSCIDEGDFGIKEALKNAYDAVAEHFYLKDKKYEDVYAKTGCKTDIEFFALMDAYVNSFNYFKTFEENLSLAKEKIN